MVQHFGIVRVELAQLERHRDGILIAIEVGVGALQVETGHTAERRIGRLLVEAFSSPGSASSWRPISERDIARRASTFGQRRLQLQGPSERRNGLGEPALLEVDQSKPRVDFGDSWLQLAQSCRTPAAASAYRRSDRRPFALLIQCLGAAGIGLLWTGVCGRCRQHQQDDDRPFPTAPANPHRVTRTDDERRQTRYPLADVNWRVFYSQCGGISPCTMDRKKCATAYFTFGVNGPTMRPSNRSTVASAVRHATQLTDPAAIG